MSEKFIVETSARHVHLTAEAFAVLFGEGKELTVKEDAVAAGSVCQ